MYELQTARWRTPGGHDVTMTFRAETNDWNTISAILTHDEYGIPRRMEGLALDIGSHVGTCAIALATDNPDLRVIAVEPVPGNATLARMNVATNGLSDRVEVRQGAVGKGDITVWYGYRGNEAAEHHAFIGNSTLAYDNGGMLPHDESTYTGLSIADLAPDGAAWTKIDTEGAEWSFLDDPAVSSLAYITGEWHPVRGYRQWGVTKLLDATHEVTFSGPVEGPGGFVAVRR